MLWVILLENYDATCYQCSEEIQAQKNILILKYKNIVVDYHYLDNKS